MTTTLDKLHVRGRGKQLVATSRACEGAAIIRVDDDARPEFWLEVTLTRAQLAALLAEMDAAT